MEELESVFIDEREEVSKDKPWRGVPSWTGLNTQVEEGFFFKKAPLKGATFTDWLRT